VDRESEQAGLGAGRLDEPRVIGLFEDPRLRALVRKLISGSQFATVGALGLIVNQVALWLLFDVLQSHHLLLSATIATQISTTFNFVGTESWVFGSRRAGGATGVIKRFVVYDAVNSSALLVRLPVLQVLTAGLHWNYLVANLLTLVAFTVLRFLIADLLIWSRPTPGRAS
jgi:putative flippase GtrA